ncbi:MAG: radical SAM protein [Dehalococcoidales bacterium]|nr:radical SAM protein [Dehalococcoidales bacterium]
MDSISYGPVPSRRLGRSLGINNIPPKICTYACVYCQLGKTINMKVDRESFYRPEEIARAVKDQVNKVKERNEPVEYLTFVPDGEPTLDINLGKEIELLRPFDIKIAIISNASLIWREDVREELGKADWVSLKIDTVSEEVWRRIIRPHKSLELKAILEGMLNFAATFKGELTTETMLILGFNDNSEELEKIAQFLAKLKPDKAYLAIPTRPPARKKIKAASESAINMAYQTFSKRLDNVEYLIGYEGNAFASTGNIKNDLLGITSVHPMREEAVIGLLEKTGDDWSVIEKLIKDGALVKLEYQGKKFYMRKLPDRAGATGEPGKGAG